MSHSWPNNEGSQIKVEGRRGNCVDVVNTMMIYLKYIQKGVEGKIFFFLEKRGGKYDEMSAITQRMTI